MHLKWHIIDISLSNVRKLRTLKNAHLIHVWNSRTCAGREAQPRLELTGIEPNSRQQSKTVKIQAHFRNEQRCIDEFEVVFV